MEVARYHVLAGGRTVAQLVQSGSLPTFLGPGHQLEFSTFDNGTEVSGAVDSAVVTTPNLRACASVIHIIDEVRNTKTKYSAMSVHLGGACQLRCSHSTAQLHSGLRGNIWFGHDYMLVCACAEWDSSHVGASAFQG